MPNPLENLVAAKQLKAEPPLLARSTLLKRAASLLTDSGNEALSPASRDTLAYDAAFALATAALRHHGFRPDTTRGHRVVVFQVLPHTVGAPMELWTALSAAHDRRNALEYSAAVAPTLAEAKDLLTQARKLDALLRGLLAKKNR